MLLSVMLQAEACDFTIITLLHGCFSCFLNCTNGTKSRKASHIKNITQNISKTMGLLRKFQSISPRSSLLAYKHSDYAGIIYDQV